MPAIQRLTFAATVLGVACLTAQTPKAPIAPTAPVTLRVTTTDGKPRACLVELARFQGHDLPLRSVAPADASPRQLAASDFRDHTVTLRDLPVGTFVLVVTAEEHAKAFSAPFQVEKDQVGKNPIEVTVQATVGASVFGQVVDEDGKPVAGASVTADDAAHAWPAPDPAALRDGWPVSRVTMAKVDTDAQGRFELPHLALGNYAIRAGHTDWCPHLLSVPPLGKDGERRDLGTLHLRRGALVSGRFANIGSQAYTLQLSDPEEPRGDAKSRLPWPYHASTQADGTFRFTQRVPPGRYELDGDLAVQLSGSNFGSFSTEVVVLPAQLEVFVPLKAWQR